MAHQELYLAWLNDAYALERSLEQVLEHRVKDAQDHPNMQARVRQHLEETRRQAERLQACIERNGGSVSSLKSGMSQMQGMMKAVSTGFAKDEHIKNALADYTSENFEIASYRSLIAAAEMLGDHQTAQVCRENLLEEEDMARFLEQQIPMITHEMLQMGAREHGR